MSLSKKSNTYMNKIKMKTSNLIALIGAALLFMMSLFFQGRVHYYVKKESATGYGVFENQTRNLTRFFNHIQAGEKIKVVFYTRLLDHFTGMGPQTTVGFHTNRGGSTSTPNHPELQNQDQRHHYGVCYQYYP